MENFVICFVRAVDIPLVDIKHRSDPYLKAYIRSHEARYDQDGRAIYSVQPISRVVRSLKRTECSSAIWNCFRDFRIKPPVEAELVVELYHAEKGSRADILLGSVTIKTSTLTSEEVRSFPFQQKYDALGTNRGFKLSLRRCCIDAPPPRQRTFFIIRHGESKWNEAQSKLNIGGMMDRDHPLTEEGVFQALDLNNRWKLEQLNAMMRLDEFLASFSSEDAGRSDSEEGERFSDQDTLLAVPNNNGSTAYPNEMRDKEAKVTIGTTGESAHSYYGSASVSSAGGAALSTDLSEGMSPITPLSSSSPTMSPRRASITAMRKRLSTKAVNSTDLRLSEACFAESTTTITAHEDLSSPGGILMRRQSSTRSSLLISRSPSVTGGLISSSGGVGGVRGVDGRDKRSSWKRLSMSRSMSMKLEAKTNSIDGSVVTEGGIGSGDVAAGSGFGAGSPRSASVDVPVFLVHDAAAMVDEDSDDDDDGDHVDHHIEHGIPVACAAASTDAARASLSLVPQTPSVTSVDPVNKKRSETSFENTTIVAAAGSHHPGQSVGDQLALQPPGSLISSDSSSPSVSPLFGQNSASESGRVATIPAHAASCGQHTISSISYMSAATAVIQPTVQTTTALPPQAEELQQLRDLESPEEDVLVSFSVTDFIASQRQTYIDLFLEADRVYCSPLTRAIQTAFCSMLGHPALPPAVLVNPKTGSSPSAVPAGGWYADLDAGGSDESRNDAKSITGGQKGMLLNEQFQTRAQEELSTVSKFLQVSKATAGEASSVADNAGSKSRSPRAGAVSVEAVTRSPADGDGRDATDDHDKVFNSVGGPLVLLSIIREVKRIGGLDTVGIEYGSGIMRRARSELGAILGSQEADRVLSPSLDTNDANLPWWTPISSYETEKDTQDRIREFLTFVRYCDAEFPVFVGHSLFFRSFYSKRISKFLRRNRPELVANMKKYRLSNATLMAVTIQYVDQAVVSSNIKSVGSGIARRGGDGSGKGVFDSSMPQNAPSPSGSVLFSATPHTVERYALAPPMATSPLDSAGSESAGSASDRAGPGMGFMRGSALITGTSTLETAGAGGKTTAELLSSAVEVAKTVGEDGEALDVVIDGKDNPLSAEDHGGMDEAVILDADLIFGGGFHGAPNAHQSTLVTQSSTAYQYTVLESVPGSNVQNDSSGLSLAAENNTVESSGGVYAARAVVASTAQQATSTVKSFFGGLRSRTPFFSSLGEPNVGNAEGSRNADINQQCSSSSSSAEGMHGSKVYGSHLVGNSCSSGCVHEIARGKVVDGDMLAFTERSSACQGESLSAVRLKESSQSSENVSSSSPASNAYTGVSLDHLSTLLPQTSTSSASSFGSKLKSEHAKHIQPSCETPSSLDCGEVSLDQNDRYLDVNNGNFKREDHGTASAPVAELVVVKTKEIEVGNDGKQIVKQQQLHQLLVAHEIERPGDRDQRKHRQLQDLLNSRRGSDNDRRPNRTDRQTGEHEHEESGVGTNSSLLRGVRNLSGRLFSK